MKELEQYRTAMTRLPEGCKAAEAEAEKKQTLSVEIVEGKTGRMSCSEQTELFVRASGQKTGMVYMQKLDENAEDVIEKALSNSLASAADAAEPMAGPELWKNAAECEGNYSLVSVEELKAKAASLAAELSKLLAAEGDEKAAGAVRLELAQTILTMGIVNSNGIDRTAMVSRFTAEVMTDTEFSFSGFRLEEISAEKIVDRLRLRAILKQPVIAAKSGVFRAVLSSEAINNILITAWQMFSARRALNKSTPLAGCVGEKVFASCISINDYRGGEDSAIGHQCGFSWRMDCEGVPSRDLALVENGVLKGWMHNLTSAEQMGEESTGNAGRRTLLSGNIHTDMAIMPKNFTIEAGEASLDELIEECADGVYVFENYDQFHALNVVTGDFSFPCKAVRIRNGKPVGIMEGLTMTGNVVRLLSDAEIIGRDRDVTPMVMYESYTVSGPAMLVKSLKISG